MRVVVVVSVLLMLFAGSAFAATAEPTGEKDITGYGELAFGLERAALIDLGYSDSGAVSDYSYWIKLNSKYQIDYDRLSIGDETLRMLVGATVTGGKVDGVQMLSYDPMGERTPTEAFGLLRGALLAKYDPSLITEDVLQDGDRGSLKLKDQDGDEIMLFFPNPQNTVSLMYLTKAAALRVHGETDAGAKL